MIDSNRPTRTRPIVLIGIPLLIGALVCVGTIVPACGGTQSNSSPPQTSAAVIPAPDAGLPTPVPNRKGLIVPSDTGIGSMPAGSAPSTGTAGPNPSPIGN